MSDFKLSLRPWPKESQGSTLPTLIQRINAERGDFRNLTEAALEAEITKKLVDPNAIVEDGASSESEDEPEPDRLKELMEQKGKLLQLLDQAHYAAVFSRDFLALAMTKTNPTQAQATISPQLRETVPIGTIGMDKLARGDTRLSIAKRDDNIVVGRGWKLQALNRSADTILAAATRLEKEIDSETKYWQEVLAVDQKGWKVCRLPQQKHTLGVRFGFFEAAPGFRNRSLAALQRRDDGSIYLDQGLSDPTPKRVLIRIETNGVITGSLKPERAVSDDAALEPLILRARNTIFEEELWQELNRESRGLASHGVRWDGTGLRVPLSPTTTALLTLEILDDTLPDYNYSHEHDHIAEMVSLSLHLLLLYNHRQNLHRRRQPPAPISHQPKPAVPVNLLRPLLKRIHHESILSTLNRTITSIHTVLASAGISGLSHTISHVPRYPPLSLLQKTKKPQAEAAIESLIGNLEAEYTIPLTLNPPQSIAIRLRTEMNLMTLWQVRIVPQQPQIQGGLQEVARPPLSFGGVEDVRAYLFWAAGCALAVGLSYSLKSVKGEDEDKMDVDGEKAGEGWALTSAPGVVKRVEGGKVMQVALSMKGVDDGAVLTAALKLGSGEKAVSKTIKYSSSEVAGMSLMDTLAKAWDALPVKEEDSDDLFDA